MSHGGARPRGGRPKTTGCFDTWEQLERQVVQLYVRGMSMEQVALSCGVGRSTVGRILRRKGVTI